MILNEFDYCKTAIINPNEFINKIEGFPEIGITCFSQALTDKVLKTFDHEQIAEIASANGCEPIYKIIYKGLEIAFFKSKVGAASCTTGYEEITAMGLEKLIMFGTCGVLSKEIEDLAIIIPTSALRDEGTSYHYVEANDEIEVNTKYKEEFLKILNEHNYSYIFGKTWTTDAPYRETQAKVQKRKEQGAVCVEMECASMAAVSQFRGTDFFQFLYAADNLDDTKWDTRSLSCAINLNKKEQIALLAFELAIKIA